MGDQIELQITPKTPGRPSIRNPFESPNDHHHLCKALVPSPSIFKSKPCKATPSKFNWSIDDMACLLPVDIDPEEIQRQSFYLSQTRLDSDAEKKCQNAIEQFFTKGVIVPSPWAAPEIRRDSQLDKKSPVTAEKVEKNSVGCQTALSLPITFDLEKILGGYYRSEETADATPENLSASTLRRKLFLDGRSSQDSSDSSTPPSPERIPATSGTYKMQSSNRKAASSREEPVRGDALLPVFSSPLSYSIAAKTPSTGQFSSSPIQHECIRDCSLGSMSSPLFPDRSSPARCRSPTVSPILANFTPPNISVEKKEAKNLTPVLLGAGVPSCKESPFIEGCSPIRSCSPHSTHKKIDPQHIPRHRFNWWVEAPQNSPILNTKLQRNQEITSLSSSPSSMELGPLSPLAQNAHPALSKQISLKHLGSVKMDEDKEAETESTKSSLNDEEEECEEPVERMSSSHMGNMSETESCQMFLSLLAEGSSIRCDSSMQVDSGYNTTSAGAASLIDGLGMESQTKESLCSNLDDAFTRHIKVKGYYLHH